MRFMTWRQAGTATRLKTFTSPGPPIKMQRAMRMRVFQTFRRDGVRPLGSDRTLSGRPLPQATAWQMLQRHARAAGIETVICNHTFRATGITTYLKNGGTLERAAHMASHSSTRTTQLYDRRSDEVTLDEIEKIQI